MELLGISFGLGAPWKTSWDTRAHELRVRDPLDYLQLNITLERAPDPLWLTGSSSFSEKPVNCHPDGKAKCLRTGLYWYSLPGILVALGDHEIMLLTSVFLGHVQYSIFYSTTEQSGIGTTMHLTNRNMEHMLSILLATEPPIIGSHWNKVASSSVPALFWEATWSLVLNTFSNSEPHLTLIAFLQLPDKGIPLSKLLVANKNEACHLPRGKLLKSSPPGCAAQTLPLNYFR